jgi:hypothetical protein
MGVSVKRLLPGYGQCVHGLDYGSPGPLTDLASIESSMLGGGNDPVTICAVVAGLVVQPRELPELLPARVGEKDLRPAASIVQRLLAMDPSPLAHARPPQLRVVGTCRHFAVLACALLRRQRIPARVRCGFATYFRRGLALDHWVVEYRSDDGRWVLLDPEILHLDVVAHPEDLPPGAFLTGAEAWLAFRAGAVDAATFGVDGTANWGPAEIKGNLVRDVAALNKVEMLPWDEWGRMTEAYEDRTGPDYDALLDEAAQACTSDNETQLVGLFGRPEFRVPADLIV